MKVTSIIAT